MYCQCRNVQQVLSSRRAAARAAARGAGAEVGGMAEEGGPLLPTQPERTRLKTCTRRPSATTIARTEPSGKWAAQLDEHPIRPRNAALLCVFGLELSLEAEICASWTTNKPVAGTEQIVRTGQNLSTGSPLHVLKSQS